jgi:energy-converting hydrogenase Eha subunit C
MRFLGFLVLFCGVGVIVAPNYVDLAGFGLPQMNYTPVGVVMIVLGGMLIGRASKRRRIARREKTVSKTSSIGYRQPDAEPQPEKRKPDITWGREGDDD